MKKRILSMLLAMTLVLSMAACSGGEKAESGSAAVNEVEEEQTYASESSEAAQGETKISEEDLGRWVKCSVSIPGDPSCTDSQIINAYFPKDYGVKNTANSPWGWKSMDYPDQIQAQLRGQSGYHEETVDALEDVFTVYEEEIIEDIVDLHNYTCKDFGLNIAETEIVEINGRQMCRYEGTVTFVDQDYQTKTETSNEKFLIGYATQAANGAYVWWFVLGWDKYADEISADAEHIAQTFVDVP